MAEKKVEIKDFITGKVTYDEYGQYLWINEPGGGSQMLAECRGHGRIQGMFKDGTSEDANKFQDKVGEFIAEAINEKMERDQNDKKRADTEFSI